MKVVLSWLNELAPVGAEADALADRLSALGMAVEEIERVGAAVDGVVVARVLSLRPHPQADRIQLVDVDAGDGAALQICCGAFNMAEGDLVPLATLGTTMPNGMEIARRKLRGEWSNGMLCSGRELGLGDDAAGIIVLPSDLRLGAPVFEALGVTEDVVFDLDVTRNRPDAWCHAGVARDLAAALGVPFHLPLTAVEASGPQATVPVEVADTDRCWAFSLQVVDGVRVARSPPWLAERLQRAGMRPINNLVDASNYVMLELGRPNHAYDLAKLPPSGLRVRLARPGERLVTLDGVDRELGADDLLICDGEDRPIGLAGIMGGADTEIDDDTTSVALEAAWFAPVGVAATVARLGLRSEASARFERGIDPAITALAVARFVELLRLTCPKARLAPGGLDLRSEGHEPPQASVRTARANALLGTSLGGGDIRGLLEPIGFEVVGGGDDRQDVRMPTWRPDCETEIDLVEEIARHYGYERLGKAVPSTSQAGRLTERQQVRRLLRDVLQGLGLSEAMPLPLLGPGDHARAGLAEEAIAITNPMAAELSLLRSSLRPGLLASIGYNASHRCPGVGLFEIGHVFRPPTDVTAPLPDEREVLAVAWAGRDARDAVAVWDELADALAIRTVGVVATQSPGLHPTRAAALVAGDGTVGLVAEIDPDVLAGYGVAERAAWLEVDIDLLLAVPHGERPYRRVSRMPSSDVDLAFSLADDVAAAELEGAVRDAVGPLLADLQLFDVYRGSGVAEGSRSLALRLRLQAPDRTLTDADIAGARDAAIAAATEVGAHPRT